MNFLKYIENNSVKIPFSGCAVWFGAVTAGGYGRSAVAQRVHGTTIVHRAVFQEIHGHVPKEMYVCHDCDTPACVNPNHLFLGTPSDNAQDRKIKGRSSPRCGESNGRSALTAKQVAAMRGLLAEGITQKDIANDFSISQSTVSHIKRGYTWGGKIELL